MSSFDYAQDDENNQLDKPRVKKTIKFLTKNSKKN